jgi:hypothetical protein
MNTPMIGFRLDPKLTALMDDRCQDLNISRAEFLRGLIVGELGIPLVEGEPDRTDVQLAIVNLGHRVGDLDSRLDQMGSDFEIWVQSKLKAIEGQLGDRIGRIESHLGQRRS